MSTQPASTETYREKALRKFKQQPLVPLGAAATTVALIVAMVKMRKGQQHSFNNWLRVRILAQGLTVAAVVGGSWAYSADSTSVSQRGADEAAAAEKAAADRAAFEERLRAAEETHRVEMGGAPRRAALAPPADAPVQAKAKAGWSAWWPWSGGSGSGTPSEKPS